MTNRDKALATPKIDGKSTVPITEQNILPTSFKKNIRPQKNSIGNGLKINAMKGSHRNIGKYCGLNYKVIKSDQLRAYKVKMMTNRIEKTPDILNKSLEVGQSVWLF